MNWFFVPVIGSIPLFMDVASKAWAQGVLEASYAFDVAPFLRLRLGYNSGVAFSLFAGLGASTYISILTSLLIAGLAWMAVQASRDIERVGLAVLGFHAAWMFDNSGKRRRQRVRDARSNEYLSSSCARLDRTARRIDPKNEVPARP